MFLLNQGQFRLLFSSVALLAAITASPAVAQVAALSAGSVQIGGQATFNIQDNDDGAGNVTSLTLSPSAQFFVSTGLALGGEVRLGYTSVGDFDAWTYGVGPAITYYFVREGNTHPFLRGSARYMRFSISDNDDEDQSITGVRATAGLLFLLTQSVGIDAGLYYDYSDGSGDIDFNETNYGLALGISAFVF
jgi:hypothetical protein